jgi:DNA-binding MarR family transcriptional regulator
MAAPAGQDVAVSLYVSLGRIVRALRQEAPNSEIGPGGLSVLVVLDGQGVQRIGALAEAVAVTAPSMTRIVNALVAEGLVVRQQDPDDGRAQVVAMTPSGRSLLTSGKEVKLAALRRRLSELAPEELARLEGALPALEILGVRARPSGASRSHP